MAEHPNLNQDHNAPFVTQNFLLQMHVFSFNGISSAMTGTKARYRPLKLKPPVKALTHKFGTNSTPPIEAKNIYTKKVNLQ